MGIKKRVKHKVSAAVGHATGLGKRKFDGKVYQYEYGYLTKKEADDYAEYLRKEKGWLARAVKTTLYKWCVFAHRR